MTTQERFEHIESTRQATADTLKTVAESQATNQAATAALIKAQAHTQDALSDMAASIGKYVDAAEARTKRTSTR